MKTNNMNDKLNLTNMQELTPEEMENVAGGGIKEIVAATTLAAMAMTGNTVGAFGLAEAMAENAGSAHIEEAPRQETFGAEYEGEMVEAIAVESEAVEAEVAETTLELGGEMAEVEPVVEEVAVVAEVAAPTAVYEVGGQRVMKLNALARACGIEGAILGAGAVNEDDTVKFVVFMDEEGDLAIEFTRSFREMELGFQTESGIPTAMLVNAVTEETAEEAAEEETTEEAAGEEALEEQSPLRQIVEEIMTANGGGLVDLLDAVNGRLHGSVDEDILRDALFGALLARFGDELSEEELLDAIDASFVRAGEDATVMEGITEEERADLLSRLIYDTVAAKREEGIYAALNSTMEAVVFSDVREADPATGEIALNDNEIVGATFDALQANFDNTSEELMGAIGAAALRAENSGLLPMLSGDQQLVMLAAQESTDKAEQKQASKVMRSLYDSTLDGISLALPEFKPLVPMLKMLGGNMFDLGNTTDNTNAEILARIEELETEVKKTAENLKNHTYNVVQLSSLGDKYNTVADKAATIRTYIGDIQFDTNKTNEQKLQEIADLYKDSEFKSLVSAMNGATRCFTSRENDIFENQNVFEAAYERACEEVMFSKEAIDLTLPYLARQLNTYVAACATMAEVYSAQVAVYGESAVLQSRTDMSLRLTGCDLKGNKVQKSVLELYEDYFGRDKFIFVNKSNNTNVKLNTEIKCVDHYAKQMLNQRDPYTDAGTPDFMKNNPLSASQVKDLAKYCGEKNITLFEFLFNRIGFKPTGMKDNIIVYVPGSTTIQVPTLVTVPEEWSFEMVELTVDEMVVRMDSAINDWNVKIKELEEKETKTEAETLRLERFKEELQTLKDQKEGLKNGTVKVKDIWLVGYYHVEKIVTPAHTEMVMKAVTVSSDKWVAKDSLYLVTGSQNYKKEHQTVYHGYCNSPYYIYCQAIKADKVGEGDKKIMLHNSRYSEENFNNTLMFFQKR